MRRRFHEFDGARKRPELTGRVTQSVVHRVDAPPQIAMRSWIAISVTAALIAMPPAGAAAPAGDRAAMSASSSASSSAKPAKARPRNAIDRSSSDPGAATFRSFDSNDDGYISRDEAGESGELSRRFDALDRNRDGRLSPAEVTGWRNVSYRPAASNLATAVPVPGEVPGNLPPTAAPKR